MWVLSLMRPATRPLVLLSLALALLAPRDAKAGMMLTPAGEALGFSLSVFADSFPNFSSAGPLGIAFPTSRGVLVTDKTGSIYRFPADTDAYIVGYDTTSGALAFLSDVIPGTPDGAAVGIGPLAGRIFTNTNGGQVVAVNLTTKVETVIASGGSRGDFATLDPSNGSLLLTQTDEILRLTPPAGGFGGGAVPEPSSLVLMSSGLLGFLDCRGFRPSRLCS